MKLLGLANSRVSTSKTWTIANTNVQHSNTNLAYMKMWITTIDSRFMEFAAASAAAVTLVEYNAKDKHVLPSSNK